MATKNLENLFIDQLKDVYFAEKKILKGLKKMRKAATAPELQKAFDKHYEETEGQIERLEQIFELCEKRPQGKTCEAIEGLLEEAEEIMDEYKDSPALDAGLIASAQAVEHYEIARYGTMRRWAQLLGMNEAVRLIEQTLKQEEKTDDDLTKLADKQVNEKALREAA